MGKYFFQNGSVYWQKDSQFGVVSKEEFKKDAFPKDNIAQVLINNVDFKTISISDINAHLVDDQVASEFSPNLFHGDNLRIYGFRKAKNYPSSFFIAASNNVMFSSLDENPIKPIRHILPFSSPRPPAISMLYRFNN